MRRWVLVSLMLLAACGSDTTLSQEEFVAEGDALCRTFEMAADEFDEPETPEELTDLLGDAIRLTRRLRDDFAELEPDDDGAEVKAAFLDAIDRTLDKAEDAHAAAAAGDVQAAEAHFTDASEAAQSADEQLLDHGFADCAERE